MLKQRPMNGGSSSSTTSVTTLKEIGMRVEFASLLAVLLCGCAAGQKNPVAAQYTRHDSVDARVMLEMLSVSRLDERYRGCLESSDEVVPKALRHWRKLRGSGDRPSLLLINLGGDYITGNYLIVMSRNGKPFVYFSDDSERIDLPENVYESIMRVASTSEPTSLQLDEGKAIPAQHAGCQFAAYLEGTELKVFRAFSDNAGIDSIEIAEFNEPIFSIINGPDN
jgi:hypothetical protein